MTTAMSPANRQAFLQAIREDQGFREEARALLLTPELLTLPEQVAALTDRVAALTDQMAALTARVDRFIAAQEAINAAQQEFNAAQQEFNQAVEIRLSRLEGQVANLTTQVANLTAQVSKLTERVDDLTTQVGHLQGSDLEFRVQGRIHSLIHRHLKFRGAQVLKSQSVHPNQSFYNFLYDAVDRNRITDDDIVQILATDLVLRARLPDSTEQVYVAVEVSRTVGNDDITRARERADLLAAAAGAQGRAVVIGTFIPEPQRKLADTLGVALFQEN